VRTREDEELVELDFQHALPLRGAGAHVAITMDPAKGMFITGYKVFAIVPGLDGERLKEDVAVKPVEAQPGIWFPAEVTCTMYSIDTGQPVMRADITFADVELNIPDLPPESMALDLPPGTFVSDMTAPDEQPAADREWEQQAGRERLP
jgi:hypothetical protein